MKIETRIRLSHYKGMICPESIANGKVISKEDWYYIKRRIDAFYAQVSSDDIDWINKGKAELAAEHAKKRETAGFIYLLKSDNGYYKIGRSVDVEVRTKAHMRTYPLTITTMHSFFVKNYVKAETHLLRMFADKKLQGEWFALEKDDIDFIMGITDEIAQRLF